MHRLRATERGGRHVTHIDGVLAAQAIASCAMCGLIWFVQVVHYPLFASIDISASSDYADRNQQRTPWVVIPPMLVEAVTAAIIVAQPPSGIGRPIAAAGLAMVAALWLSTLLVQMPLHSRLKQGHAPELVTALVRTNWTRTALWSARALLAVWMLRAA